MFYFEQYVICLTTLVSFVLVLSSFHEKYMQFTLISKVNQIFYITPELGTGSNYRNNSVHCCLVAIFFVATPFWTPRAKNVLLFCMSQKPSYTLSCDAIKIVASPSYTLHTVQYTVCYKTTGLGTQDASPLQVYRLHLPKQERYNVQWCIPCCIYHSRNLSNLETNRTKETAGWCYEFSFKRLI